MSPRLASRACVIACAIVASQGAQATTVLGANLRVDFADAKFSNGSHIVSDWIERSMGIVAAYYGQFPVRDLYIRVESAAGHGVKTGTAFGMRGGTIRVVVGSEVTEGELLRDWVLVHEMIHLALPDIGRKHIWLSEGLATYVEGIARAHAGNRTEEDVWAEQMRSMPKGMPQEGDEGLDRTHTWGRTYWGGALFCLMADIQIHRASGNRLGLRDALRAVLRASGGLGTDWPLERVLATGDAAVGSRVLQELYDEWKNKPISPDLATIWRSLGIESDGATVRLRDDAPDADIRRAIMRP